MKENINAEVNKRLETIERLKRERERANFNKIGFISCVKNKLNRNINRIGYKNSEAAKLKIAYPFITKACTRK